MQVRAHEPHLVQHIDDFVVDARLVQDLQHLVREAALWLLARALDESDHLEVCQSR